MQKGLMQRWWVGGERCTRSNDSEGLVRRGVRNGGLRGVSHAGTWLDANTKPAALHPSCKTLTSEEEAARLSKARCKDVIFDSAAAIPKRRG